MMASTLSHAAESMHGILHGQDVSFRGVNTDTRSLRPGELFVALQGPNFDGCDFVAQAAAKEAAGAVVPKPLDIDLPTIVVDDTLAALGELAASWRQEMNATVIGITGSNGKTTLKELLASCLSISAETLATAGNLNNQIGLPLMLLRLSETHRYAVIEMGANHPGEIAYLTSLASPRIVAITNAGPAHLEGFGSVRGVSRAKGEILAGKESPEFAILNADDDYFDYWKSLVREATVVSFGLCAAADVRAEDIKPDDHGSQFILHTPNDQFSVRLSLQGKHNIVNACAAAAIAWSLGISSEQIRDGLEATKPIGGRLRPVTSESGAILFDDTYNANPVSVQAASEFLAAQPGTTWLVLGDMGELGKDASTLHAQTGQAAKDAGVTYLLATGPMSQETVKAFGNGGRWFESVDALSKALRSAIGNDDKVLVKGSRSMGMERVVAALTGAKDSAGGA